MEEENSNRNIVLIGMPGAGKTYIGRKLAKLLNHFTYVDTDEEIETRAGLTVSEIFETHSEKYFRELESKTIKEVSQHRNQIISLGGGAFENPDNIAALKKNSLIYYLQAPIKELFKRIENEVHRPLLSKNFSPERLRSLLKKREKNYLKAHFVIDTNQKQAYTILDDILREYENYVKQRNFC